MKVCPFRLVGVEELPSALTARASIPPPEEVTQAFACIGTACMLFRIEPKDLGAGKLEEGWCALGRSDY